MAHKSRNIWNGGGGGGGGGGGDSIHPQFLFKNGCLNNCLLFGTPVFVLTTNWLQLSILL